MRPSLHVRNLLETAVLDVQHSPDLSEEEVRSIQQFAMRLISEFSVVDEPNAGSTLFPAWETEEKEKTPL